MSSQPLPRSLAAAGTLLVAALALPAAAVATHGEIRTAQPYPLRGQAIELTVSLDGAPAAGLEIEAHYRPNSETDSVELLPLTDSLGKVSWVPREAGIVTLTARDPEAATSVASLNVAVRYGRFPAQGLGIMILAGVLLFGGVTFGFARLLRADALPTEEPPST